MRSSISIFAAPISPFSKENGEIVGATTKPEKAITIIELFKLISNPSGDLRYLTEEVRKSADLRQAKCRLLPYVTVFGEFSYRRSDKIVSYSGLFPIDIDHLESTESARRLRDSIFENQRLSVSMAYVSPSGKGVKLFIPYENLIRNGESRDAAIRRTQGCAQRYIEHCLMDGIKGEVDSCGTDLARASFICYDPEVRFRENF